MYLIRKPEARLKELSFGSFILGHIGYINNLLVISKAVQVLDSAKKDIEEATHKTIDANAEEVAEGINTEEGGLEMLLKNAEKC